MELDGRGAVEEPDDSWGGADVRREQRWHAAAMVGDVQGREPT